MSPAILWFRQDLRLQDNPALHAALARGGPIVPVYIWDEAGEWGWAPGTAGRWWLHHSLVALDAALRERGSKLVLLRGDTETCLAELARTTGANALYWNRRYELAAVARDSWIEAELPTLGIAVHTFNGALLNEPHTIANRQRRPFQVFSPYWRNCLTQPVPPPLKLAPEPLPSPSKWPRSATLAEFDLLPAGERFPRFAGTWQPGEAGAADRLRRFTDVPIEHYADGRDLMAQEGTSRLSPHLHFGEIGPRQIWAAVRNLGRSRGVFPPHKGAAVFLSQLGWREFGYHLLFNFPHTQELPLHEPFSRFPWADDPGDEKLRAWQLGRTGYPIVDAGMRQLIATGWMHNRARMITASFLVKHLRLNWRSGARWFWENLVDADIANNTLGWQWSAGCGADAAPYFRIFAPVLQGQKFDRDGEYVRRWVPELAALPAKYVHAPWTAPDHVLQAARVRLGENYPRPIVDHAKARSEALDAFRDMKSHASAAPF
jgi:deoxyribodipyrimidine photo-lyase